MPDYARACRPPDYDCMPQIGPLCRACEYRSSQLTLQRRVQCACNNLTIHAMYKLYLVGTVVSPAEPGPGASEPAQHCQAVNEAQ